MISLDESNLKFRIAMYEYFITHEEANSAKKEHDVHIGYDVLGQMCSKNNPRSKNNELILN